MLATSLNNMSLPDNVTLLAQRVAFLGCPLLIWWCVYLNERNQIFALAMLYQYCCCIISTFAPNKFIYGSGARHLETLHRTRFLIEYIVTPCLIWVLLWPILMGVYPLVTVPVLALMHGYASFVACEQLRGDYPFTPETRMGILQWKPARLSQRMLAPVNVINMGLRIHFGLRLIFFCMPQVPELWLGLGKRKSDSSPWQVLFAGIACLWYHVVCVLRRGTDNEQHFTIRNMAELFVATMLK